MQIPSAVSTLLVERLERSVGSHIGDHVQNNAVFHTTANPFQKFHKNPSTNFKEILMSNRKTHKNKNEFQGSLSSCFAKSNNEMLK